MMKKEKRERVCLRTSSKRNKSSKFDPNALEWQTKQLLIHEGNKTHKTFNIIQNCRDEKAKPKYKPHNKPNTKNTSAQSHSMATFCIRLAKHIY